MPELTPMTAEDFRPQYEGQKPCCYFLRNWYTCSHEICRRNNEQPQRKAMNDTTRILYFISAWNPACPLEMICEGMKAQTAIQAAAVIRTLEALESTELVTLTREQGQITWAALTDLGKERLQEAEKEMLHK